MLFRSSFPFDGASDFSPAFTYSIRPHSGNRCDGGVVEKAYVLNRPFFVREVDKNTTGKLLEEYSLIDCKTKGVIFETVKRAEDGQGIILRAYEGYRERKEVELTITNAKEVFLCDLNENQTEKLELCGNTVKFTVKPFEIITIKVKTA